MNLTDRHALKFAQLGVAEQQRVLKKLAKNSRARQKARMGNSESEEANRFDWHRNVRLKKESRAINIIRGYFKGLKYKQIENSTRESTLSVPILFSFYDPVHFNYVEWDNFMDWVLEEE